MSIDLPQRVEQQRTQLGMSVRSAASRGGISNTQWGRYEAGEAPLSDNIIEAVAKAFKWPMDWPQSVPAINQPEALVRLAQLEGVVIELLDEMEKTGWTASESLAEARSRMQADQQSRPATD